MIKQANEVEDLEQRVVECYQCGKCSAGCPAAENMDLMPNQVIRLVQLGQIDKALRAESLWLCVSCQTCSTRCPKKVDCAGILDVLRQKAYASGVATSEQKRTLWFYRTFLDNIRRHGRVHELELVGLFKMKSFLGEFDPAFLFKDSLLAPKLIQRGKFHLFPGGVRDRGIVKRIFERCQPSESISSKPTAEK